MATLRELLKEDESNQKKGYVLKRDPANKVLSGLGALLWPNTLNKGEDKYINKRVEELKKHLKKKNKKKKNRPTVKPPRDEEPPIIKEPPIIEEPPTKNHL